MLVNKITIELYQEANNDVGNEHMEVTANPALLGLYDHECKPDYYLTLKSEDGFSFEDSKEIIKTFENIEKIIEQSLLFQK